MSHLTGIAFSEPDWTRFDFWAVVACRGVAVADAAHIQSCRSWLRRHEARRHIVLLLGHSGGELPSGYLAKRFQHSWPTTTRHLKVLEEAGLVEVRRHGRSSHYKLKRDHVQRVLGAWIGMLDAPSPTKTWAPTGPRSIAQLSKATATQKGKR